MTLRQTLFLSILTFVYLLTEFAFNARLLDVVGSAPSTDQVHQIEKIGRTLSGIAFALVALQFMLARRAKTKGASPGWFAMAMACFFVGAVVYSSIQMFVDHLVEKTSLEFRRAAVTMPMLQQSLIAGSVQLDGLSAEGDAAIFSKPEGKSFLAMFPMMALFVERLDEKIAKAKLDIVIQNYEKAFGGIGGYYANYQLAISTVKKKHDEYLKGVFTPQEVEERAQYEADKAWADYVSDLKKRGWTPWNVPFYAKARVRSNVASKVSGLPRNWEPGDEQGFRAAVERRVRSSMQSSIAVKGKKIPAGLSFSDFLAHPAIQEEIRKPEKKGGGFKFPSGIKLKGRYETEQEFRSVVFDPLMRELAEAKIKEIDAPIETYQPGGYNFESGLDGARSVIAPPVALGFSLFGALMHVSKLVYLLVKAFAMQVNPGGTLYRWSFASVFLVLGILWSTLSLMSNPVTQSRLYAYLYGQVSSSGGVVNALAANGMHVVAVGQGFLYPMNEAIRVKLFSRLF